MHSNQDTEMDDSAATELEIVKDQLLTYQALNGDLSRKVQEFKISVNATNKELTSVRQELLKEKLKCSELRRALMQMNGQVTSFFSGYMNNLQTCIERTDLDITLPGETHEQPEREAGTSQSAVLFRPASKFQQTVAPPVTDDLNPSIFLNTIYEEPGSPDDSLVASTPLLLSAQANAGNDRSPTEARPSTPPSVMEESSTEAAISVTPKRSLCDARLSRRLSDEDDPRAEPEPDTDKENEGSLIAQIPSCSVEVVKFRPSDGTLEKFEEAFLDGDSKADPDASSETSEASISKAGRKRKITLEAKRRSSGRPKRKAKASIATLVERPLKPKLRRSK